MAAVSTRFAYLSITLYLFQQGPSKFWDTVAAEYILPSENLHLCVGPKAGNTYCYIIGKSQSQWKGKWKEKK